jgi:hypothetical protein
MYRIIQTPTIVGATEAELVEARKIAQGMIRGYLKHVENKH